MNWERARLANGDKPELHPAIVQFEKPLRLLLDKLRQGIENQRYGLLIGDDRGGRLPASILGQVINTVYEKKGLPKSPLIFLQGLGWPPPPNPEIYLEFLRQELEERTSFFQGIDPKKKVLLITDWMLSGWTMRNFGQVLTERGLQFDIATLSMKSKEETYRARGWFSPETKLYSGPISKPVLIDNIPGLTTFLTGLEKNQSGTPTVVRDSWVRTQVIGARRDAKILSEQLTRYYLSRKIRILGA